MRLKTALLVLAGLTTLPCASALAQSWSCSYHGYVTHVSLDRASHLLTVADQFGRTDQGYAIFGSLYGAPYTEYYLPYDSEEYAYYLRLWNNGAVTFSYCWDCAPYTCSRLGDLR